MTCPTHNEPVPCEVCLFQTWFDAQPKPLKNPIGDVWNGRATLAKSELRDYCELRDQQMIEQSRIHKQEIQALKDQIPLESGFGEQHEAFRYREIHDGVVKMGGWANFKHWILQHSASYFKTCENLKAEIEAKDKCIAELKETVSELLSKSNGRQANVLRLKSQLKSANEMIEMIEASVKKQLENTYFFEINDSDEELLDGYKRLVSHFRDLSVSMRDRLTQYRAQQPEKNNQN